MENKTGFYSVAASTVTSILIVVLFYIFAIQKVDPSAQYIYSNTDVYAGMVYVFILSMIVSVSIWPEVIEKRLKKQ